MCFQQLVHINVEHVGSNFGDNRFLKCHQRFGPHLSDIISQTLKYPRIDLVKVFQNSDQSSLFSFKKAEF